MPGGVRGENREELPYSIGIPTIVSIDQAIIAHNYQELILDANLGIAIPQPSDQVKCYYLAAFTCRPWIG